MPASLDARLTAARLRNAAQLSELRTAKLAARAGISAELNQAPSARRRGAPQQQPPQPRAVGKAASGSKAASGGNPWTPRSRGSFGSQGRAVPRGGGAGADAGAGGGSARDRADDGTPVRAPRSFSPESVRAAGEVHRAAKPGQQLPSPRSRARCSESSAGPSFAAPLQGPRRRNGARGAYAERHESLQKQTEELRSLRKEADGLASKIRKQTIGLEREARHRANRAGVSQARLHKELQEGVDFVAKKAHDQLVNLEREKNARRRKNAARAKAHSSALRRWDELVAAGSDSVIRMADVPFPPVATNPLRLKVNGDGRVVATAQERRDAFRAASMRWHPDKFGQRFGSRLDPDEKGAILEKVVATFQLVNRARREPEHSGGLM